MAVEEKKYKEDVVYDGPITAQADFIGQLPSKLPDPRDTAIRPETFPLLILGHPFTREARQLALQRELTTIAKQFVDWDKTQTWVPDQLPSLREVEWLGGRKEEREAREEEGGLSDDTITILKVIIQTELREPDYTKHIIRTSDDYHSRVVMGNLWGMQERGHADGTSLLPVVARLITPAEMKRMKEEAMDNPWTSNDHPGLDDPWGLVYYTSGQEWQTKATYESADRLVRRDYGLPENLTPEERSRGYAIGISDMYRKIALQENKHSGVYISMLRARWRYFPEALGDIMAVVARGFAMPMSNKIPETPDAIRILYGDPLKTLRTLQDTLERVNAAIGLSDRKSLGRASQSVREHPEGAGLLKQDGTIIPIRIEEKAV